MKRRRGARPFHVALVFSALLHLSMVTVFRVVIYFPRNDTQYLNVDIVRTDIIRNRYGLERLELGSAEDAFERLSGRVADPLPPTLGDGTLESGVDLLDPWAGLPEVELPKLEFEELDRLRFQVRGLEIGRRYDERFGRSDLWSRFGRGLDTVTDALSSVVRRPRVNDDDVQHAIEVPDAAPGFSTYVEWLSPPFSREALGGGRIDVLWGRDPDSLREAIAIPFRVDPGGVVTEVLPPLEGEPEVVQDAMKALANYRFEPIGGLESDSQMGTFIIRGASDW